jgi:hypothetical protein
MVILGISSASNHQASAAAGVAGLSITSSASSYQIGSTFTVTITDNGSDAINSVQANINYDSAVLTEQSISTGNAAGSPLTTPLGTPTVANNQIQISVGDLGNVAGDTGPLTVAKITFLVTATGSTSISPDSSSKIYLASGSTNSYNAGSSVPLNLTLTAVPNPTCASIGKTGTYPNCVTPTPTPTCASQGKTGTYPNCVTPTPTPTCASQGKTGTYPNCVATTTNNTTNKTTTTSPGTKSSTPSNGVAIPNSQSGLYQSTPSSSGVSGSSYSGNASPILVKVTSGGKPVSGATVNLSNQKQITNSSGIANFNALPGGYTLTIKGKGIKTKTINITVLPFDPGQQFTANVDSSGLSIISAGIILSIIGLVGLGIYAAIKNKDKLSSLISKTGGPKSSGNNLQSHENVTNNSNIIVPGTFNANPVSQIIKPGTPITTNTDSAPKPIVGITGSPNHPTMEPTIIKPNPILPTTAKPTNNQIIRK